MPCSAEGFPGDPFLPFCKHYCMFIDAVTCNALSIPVGHVYVVSDEIYPDSTIYILGGLHSNNSKIHLFTNAMYQYCYRALLVTRAEILVPLPLSFGGGVDEALIEPVVLLLPA